MSDEPRSASDVNHGPGDRDSSASAAGYQDASSVRLDNVSRHFGDLKAVDGVSFDVHGGSFFSLLGPSGCGKSTTLRIIAGFEQPQSGRVLIDEDDVTRLEARKRPTAMVFQNYALFPHMTVGENVAYGLKVRKLSKADTISRVKDALKRVDLLDFIDTPVPSLSGGQQQRTALARAVAIEPRVVLFDEPLSNLDVALRHQTRAELKRLQHRLGMTSIYVTHDQEEAMALSDRVAVMRAGKIVQIGPPETLYREPDTAFVASFLGGSNVITSKGLAHAFTGQEPENGRAISIRAEHLQVAEEGAVAATIVSRQFLGAQQEVQLEFEGEVLQARLPGDASIPADPRVSAASFRSVIDDVSS